MTTINKIKNIQVYLDGWQPINTTLTFSSDDSPTFVIGTSVDLTDSIGVGMRIKLTQTTAKYFIVTAITASTITVYGGTDYTLANAAITGPYFSTHKAPLGFPLSPEKWTIEVTDTTNRTQSSATINVVYSPGSISITAPIGAWKLRAQYAAGASGSSAGQIIVRTGIQIANNAISDKALMTSISGYIFYNGAQTLCSVTIDKLVSISSKTIYYPVICYVDNGAGTTALNFSNSNSTMILRALSAYL